MHYSYVCIHEMPVIHFLPCWFSLIHICITAFLHLSHSDCDDHHWIHWIKLLYVWVLLFFFFLLLAQLLTMLDFYSSDSFFPVSGVWESALYKYSLEPFFRFLVIQLVVVVSALPILYVKLKGHIKVCGYF